MGESEPGWTDSANNPITTIPAQLEADPYFYSWPIDWGGYSMADCYTYGGSTALRMIVTQVTAPVGYVLDGAPRTALCDQNGVWPTLADGDFHYVLQPLVTETPAVVAPTVPASVPAAASLANTGDTPAVYGIVGVALLICASWMVYRGQFRLPKRTK